MKTSVIQQRIGSLERQWDGQILEDGIANSNFTLPHTFNQEQAPEFFRIDWDQHIS